MMYVFYPVNREIPETLSARMMFSMNHNICKDNKDSLMTTIGRLYHSSKPAEIVNMTEVNVVVVYNPFDLKANIEGKLRNTKVEVGCLVEYSDSDDIELKRESILKKFISDKFHEE